MDNIIKQLTDIKNKLDKPFPYKDTDRIQVDFRVEFLNLSEEEDCLTGDFNTYCMNIAGTLSYVLSGKTDKITKRQIEIFQMSFFDFFNQYKFFEEKINNYLDFYEEYKNFEETRKLLLQVVK
ncbi:YxiJ family protein [Neobacillus massiliamazoniensis]|uniref:Group-specific protein n=1 Tax=Neobacillus massiliamazoniensis TaxID=1499688 RepID=A0A0U1P3L7_9BACI|nr:YxiJ family protein [Neobacillus massiliamazoniensis]CRK84857.1 group-specific protein [Neobacillus massiliamazoniensis]